MDLIRLTDKQIGHIKIGKRRIREALKEAVNINKSCLYSYTGTAFIQLGRFKKFNWINGVHITISDPKKIIFPHDYTII